MEELVTKRKKALKESESAINSGLTIIVGRGRYFLCGAINGELSLTKTYLSSKVSRVLEKFALWVSHVGDGPLYFLKILILLISGSYSIALNYSIGYMVALISFVYIKRKTKRSRPFNKDKEIIPFKIPFDKYSFPSGHSTMAFTSASITASNFNDWGLYAYSLAILIGLSRFALGVHYLTDVFCGAILGYTIGKVITLMIL